MKTLYLNVLTVTAVLGVCPLLLQAAEQAGSSAAKLDPIVKQGTAHLDIDDATRARYRYNGQWMYQTEEGQWLVHQDGKWKPADPTTYTVPGLPLAGGNPLGPYFDQFIPDYAYWGEVRPIGKAYYDQFIPANGSGGYNGPIGTAYFDQFIPSNGSGGYHGPTGTAYYDQYIPD
ncbi:hypothetical protein Pan153_09820 [Gimesia panareensis]|uniref:Uncharacterized protein n=1 Tax=Gimesia panareensis TaxID=2527978 RepID=A0A518FJ27_9PLAN|nr:hypothetical protein [Gimesia panareensis]QDV16355.1 hypothetical protein Pan153_09820 [Gimesia panareensis]